ncbi:thiamine pyrophosphate-dependent enzyme [Jiella marina]|uniref:thiamine pyrophosphate-dependent enzyme n=1 Tax=Jiella sp. LLJ827 TaxID=2917712 RepID=UPI002100E4A4|nr:thiamine pyrophosphate-dependent enzyme [Jiella sp. LLJ827]MCQ0987993.1 thiamine pyrophosphate-dependent enzyme [Jiella sp. LLJ827]
MEAFETSKSPLARDSIEQAGEVMETLAWEMLRLRLSMLVVNELVKRRAFQVPIHLALGHEAVAVAVSMAMGAHDRLLLTHRNIHYNIARNADLAAEIAEYRLERDAPGGGRFGAMNLIAPENGIVYTSSILGNCLPVAVGVAKGRAVKQADAVTFAVTGDGALEEGAFYEALMMATSLRLPLIFLVENNDWSMYTRVAERRCALDLQRLAEAFAIPFRRLSGDDAEACLKGMTALRADVAEAQRPAIVEVTLATLGDREVTEEGKPPRTINYHHGGAAHISYEAGPIIEESERDPLYRLSGRLPAETWRRLVAEARAPLDGFLA